MHKLLLSFIYLILSVSPINVPYLLYLLFIIIFICYLIFINIILSELILSLTFDTLYFGYTNLGSFYGGPFWSKCKSPLELIFSLIEIIFSSIAMILFCELSDSKQ